MIAILAAAAIVAAPAASRCGLRSLDACRDTNQLAWVPEFNHGLVRFVGAGRTSWLSRNGKTSDQVENALGGPPDLPVKVDGGLIRFAACQAHDCPNKGAVFMTSQGRIQAVAVLHFHCQVRCDAQYTLSIIARHKDPATVALARQWADGAVAQQKADFPTESDPDIGKVEVLDSAS